MPSLRLQSYAPHPLVVLFLSLEKPPRARLWSCRAPIMMNDNDYVDDYFDEDDGVW